MKHKKRKKEYDASGVLSKCLEDILQTHVRPSENISQLHDDMVKLLMKDMENELPKESVLFKDCSVELVGSAGCNTKIVEADEYDINVIINLPFSEEEISLNFEDSSPTFASVEVTKELVSSLVSDLSVCEPKSNSQMADDFKKQQYNIFAKRNNKYIISSEKIQLISRVAIGNLMIFLGKIVWQIH